MATMAAMVTIRADDPRAVAAFEAIRGGGAIRELRCGDWLSGGELVQQGKCQWGVLAAGEGSGERFGEGIDGVRRRSRTSCWGRV
jgi:hypothetical protein